MTPDVFAAQRREILTSSDDALRPAVSEGLERMRQGEDEWWDGIVEAASQVWLENFQAEAPGSPYEASLNRFQASLAESLSLTSERTNVDRVTRWASTIAVNAGTVRGAYARGIRYKRWTTMADGDVRDVHRPLDGQIRPIGSTFNVAGARLAYPGEPVGPPNGWIECRCVAQPASREGEVMSANTFTVGADDGLLDEDGEMSGYDVIRADGQNVNPDGTPYTGALVVMTPSADDPVVAASSEPAHMTMIWFGEVADLAVDVEELEQAVRQYAQDLDGPVVVPVAERGTLGDEDADVVFLEKTDSLVALRDGLLEKDPVGDAFAEAEQFPDWTPHVTLGYSDRPARGDYDGDTVTFDHISLWLGGEHYDYPMGGGAVTAAAYEMAEVVADAPAEEDHPNPGEPEEDDDAPLSNEVPVHGVAAIEGRATGDGRSFDSGAITFGRLPQPLGFEFESSHGGSNSRVAIVGRIDEFWKAEVSDEAGDYTEVRWRGVIHSDKPYADQALTGIIDGSYGGLSVIIDAVTLNQEASEAAYDAASDGEVPTKHVAAARIRRHDMVPTPAFQEAWVGIGPAFADELSDGDRETLAACGCARGFETTVDAAFAPGTKDGGVGTLEAWSNLTSGPRPSSMTAQTTMSAGTGRGISTGLATAEWPWTGTVESARLIASSISDGSVQSPRGSSSTISAETGDASTRDTLSPSPTARTLIEETRITEALVASAGKGSTTSPVKMRGTSGLSMEFSDGRVASVTSMDVLNGIVRLSDGAVLVAQKPERVFSNPTTRDGPGWITHPGATSRIRNYWVRGEGAAKIGWGAPGDFNRCRAQLAKYVQNPDWLAGLCANMHKEALGIWPAQHAAHALTASGDSRHAIYALAEPERDTFPSEFFQRPEDEGRAFGMRIDRDTRRIYGYAASWGSCHIGIGGICKKAPPSRTDYAFFRKGVVDTDAGEQRVGLITMGIGHANRLASAANATAHYDQTDAVKAYINIGEDSYGIWYSGVLAPATSEGDIVEMRAIGRVSGDWRNWSGRQDDLEMVGLVVVNTEGFQLAASGGIQTAVVGIGALPSEALTASADTDENEAYLARVVARALKLNEDKKREEALRGRASAVRQRDLRARAKGE